MVELRSNQYPSINGMAKNISTLAYMQIVVIKWHTHFTMQSVTNILDIKKRCNTGELSANIICSGGRFPIWQKHDKIVLDFGLVVHTFCG